MENFKMLGLSEQILASLEQMGFSTPTPIQAQTIPLALQGKDILGSAQTGTGKTGAYGIPLVSYLLENKEGCALVLTPTRELALQVLTIVKQILGKNSTIKSALLIGGDPIGKQFKMLREKPRLVVGTPGRINDHLERGSLDLRKTGFVVLDEADRMLDMGFGKQLQTIVDVLPETRQTLMFSATIPSHIVKISEKYLKSPIRISITPTISPAEKITQEIIRIDEQDKYDVLCQRLMQIGNESSCIVFVKTKFSTEKLAKKLRIDNISATPIHGDLPQRKRDTIIKSFRNGSFNVLVATDIAARGLDIPGVGLVINHDLPQCEEDYIHRIGRTGRANNDGKAINLISPQDNAKWHNICRLINPSQYPGPRKSVGNGSRPFRKNGNRSRSRSFGSRSNNNRNGSYGSGFKSKSSNAFS